MGSKHGDPKSGWTCKSCEYYNFGFRNTCFKCSKARPAGGKGGKPAKPAKPGNDTTQEGLKRLRAEVKELRQVQKHPPQPQVSTILPIKTVISSKQSLQRQ